MKRRYLKTSQRTILCEVCKTLENPPNLYDCKGCMTVKARRWRTNNVEKVRVASRKHYWANVDKYRIPAHLRRRRNTLCEVCQTLENPPHLKDCRGCRNLNTQLWRSKNKEKVKEQNKKRYWANRDKYRACAKKSREKNIERLREHFRIKSALWRKNNPERARLIHRKSTDKGRYGEYWEAVRILREIEKIRRTNPVFRVTKGLINLQDKYRSYHEKKSN